MTILWASAAFALSILFFGLAFHQFRRPQMPAWASSDLVAQLAGVVIVTLFSFGTAFLVRVVVAREMVDAGAIHYGAALAALGLSALLALRLIVVGRRYAAAPPGANVIPLTPAPTDDGDNPLEPVGPRRPRRKAA